MSPSLREALALLTSDRRFAEITASFNGMNLRQRFPDLTRQEQSEIVRAARGFVQNQPAPQQRTDVAQHSTLAPPPEAARDLRASPPPLTQGPDEHAQQTQEPQEPFGAAMDTHSTEPQPEWLEADEEDEIRHSGYRGLRRSLVLGLGVLVVVVLAWILVGRTLLDPSPVAGSDDNEENIAEIPAVETEEVPAAEAETAIQSASTGSSQPDMPTQDLSTETPTSADDSTESAASGQRSSAATLANPAASPTGVVPPPAIPQDPLTTSRPAPDSEEIEGSAVEESTDSDSAAALETELATGGAEAGTSSADSLPPADDESLTTAPSATPDAVVEKPPAAETAAVEEPAPPTTRIRSVSQDPALVGQVQVRLKLVGYDPGPIDGIMGPKTASAIRAFQEDRGLRVDGEASELLLGILATYSGLQGAAAQPAVQ